MVNLPAGWRNLARPLEPSPLVRRRSRQRRADDDEDEPREAAASYRPSSSYVAELSVYSTAGTSAPPPVVLEPASRGSELRSDDDQPAVSPAVLLNLARRFPSHTDDELLLALRAANGHGGDAVQVLRAQSRGSVSVQAESARAVPSEVSAAPGLRDDKWVRYADEEGDTYYAHEVTGEVKWEPPPPELIRTMSEAEQRSHARALAQRAVSRSSSPIPTPGGMIDDDSGGGGGGGGGGGEIEGGILLIGTEDISAIATVAIADTPPLTGPPNRQVLEEAARLATRLRQESFSPFAQPEPEPEPEPEPTAVAAASADTGSAVVEVEVDAMYRYRCLAQAAVFSDPLPAADPSDEAAAAGTAAAGAGAGHGHEHGEAVVGVLPAGTVFEATELRMTEAGRLLVRYDGSMAERRQLTRQEEEEEEDDERAEEGGLRTQVRGWVSLTVEGGVPILEAV
jgi:hypothetical protein